MITQLCLVFSISMLSNAQIAQSSLPTMTSAPARYALLLRELADVTRGREALQAEVQQYSAAYHQLDRKAARDKAACRCSKNFVVAFTAHLDKDITVLGIDQPLPFDNVTLNEGHAYDARHAQFRAPVNGTFMFFASLTNKAGYQLAAEFLLNGSPVIKIRTGNENQFHTATNGLALHMNAGDDLWVQHAHAVTDSNRLFHGEGLLTTFSGYLVSRD